MRLWSAEILNEAVAEFGDPRLTKAVFVLVAVDMRLQRPEWSRRQR